MSFRSRVLDALNIEKRSIKLPIKEVFYGKQYVTSKSKHFPAACALDSLGGLITGSALAADLSSNSQTSSGTQFEGAHSSGVGAYVDWSIQGDYVTAVVAGDVSLPGDYYIVNETDGPATGNPSFTRLSTVHADWSVSDAVTLQLTANTGSIYMIKHTAPNGTDTVFGPKFRVAGSGKKYDIGGGHSQTLDYLGFVMGDEVSSIDLAAAQDEGHMDDGPASKQKPYPVNSGEVDTGFHYLGSIYDEDNKKLLAMRKSAITPEEYRTGPDDEKMWPSDHLEQCRLLTDNPMADSLIYHQTRLSFLITGIQKPDETLMGAASNHRGLVRMLIFRPIIPSCRLHINSVNGKPSIRTDYLPNMDTELFYSGKKLLGGRMDVDVAFDSNDVAQDAVTFGLDKFDTVEPTMNLDTDSIYYGKAVPLRDGDQATHRLSPFDLITAPINRKKYKVIVDKTFHLDTQHHGVASMRTEHVTIPYHLEAKFAGRIPEVSDGVQTGNLTDQTFNEPLNMKSKPIIMFLSLDQTLSVQPTGYTVISEA